jgi:L-alanine-DL-glutamate epimerase-like enolase superfamily enzyme
VERDGWPADAGALDFHRADGACATFFARAADAGFRALKVKVGPPDVARDQQPDRGAVRVCGAASGRDG